MGYATIEDIQNRMTRDLTEAEINAAGMLIEDAAIIIDTYNENAKIDNKMLVTCRMIMRALGDGENNMPIGATQGSQSGLGFSQSWTFGTGSSGEMYLSRVEKKLLGVANRIGSHSPIEDI